MSASADKVNLILETLLEDSLPLMKKGIFSQGELRTMMAIRQKHEHAMLSTAFHLTDYLKAIQYEYSIERERRQRIDAGSDGATGNPLFKKQSKTDFVIIKRIIKLWDRTTHKYKYRLYLWKQYLQFCLAIGSKKHFYKALTAALRFLPFQVELWRIGAAYEMEVGHNFWKARKIFLKGLKMVPSGRRNLALAIQMLRFQVEFMRVILGRKKIISQQQDLPFKFINPQEPEEENSDEPEQQNIVQENIKIEEYHQMLWLIVEEAIEKNTNRTDADSQLTSHAIVAKLIGTLQDMLKAEPEKEIKSNLAIVLDRLGNYSPGIKIEDRPDIIIQEMEEVMEQVPDNNALNPAHSMISIRTCNDWDALAYFKESIVKGSAIAWDQVDIAIKHFCLKPSLLGQIYKYLLEINYCETCKYLQRRKKNEKLPLQAMHALLSNYDKDLLDEDVGQFITAFLSHQIDKHLTAEDYRSRVDLLKQAITFNQQHGRALKNAAIFRSIQVHFKKQIGFIELCSKMINTA